MNVGQVIGYVDGEKKGSTEETKAPSKDSSSKEEKKEEEVKKEQPLADEKPVEEKKEPQKEEAPKTSPSKEQKEVFAQGRGVRKSIDQSLQENFEKKGLEVKKQAPSSSPQEVKKDPGVREERKSLSKIRKTIAKRLVEAKQSMALLTTFNEVDMSAVLELRKKYKEPFLKQYQVRLGFMSFFVKAAVSALKAYPLVNSYLDKEDLVYRHYYDINVAISTEKGLVVPVLADCDKLSYAEIEMKIADLATKAKEGALTMQEMRSGGFTISNGGVFGSTFSTPIVNPPQTAILGMHRIIERPCAVNGQVVIRPVMILALSYDHRVIDGQEAVSFLAHIVKTIEDPAFLLIDLK